MLYKQQLGGQVSMVRENIGRYRTVGERGTDGTFEYACTFVNRHLAIRRGVRVGEREREGDKIYIE